jgi:hypothetical protein
MTSGAVGEHMGLHRKTMHESQGCRFTPLSAPMPQRSALGFQSERSFRSRFAVDTASNTYVHLLVGEKNTIAMRHLTWTAVLTGASLNCIRSPMLFCALVGCSLEWQSGCPMYCTSLSSLKSLFSHASRAFDE